MASRLPLLALSLAVSFGAAPPADTAPAGSPALAAVRSICIETLEGSGSLGKEARDIATSVVFAAKRIQLTEDCVQAEAILRGTVSLTSTERVRSAEGITAILGGDSVYSKETRWRATVSLRLSSQQGSVVWASTAESQGGKSKGPLVDAVDRALRSLLRSAESR